MDLCETPLPPPQPNHFRHVAKFPAGQLSPTTALLILPHHFFGPDRIPGDLQTWMGIIESFQTGPPAPASSICSVQSQAGAGQALTVHKALC